MRRRTKPRVVWFPKDGRFTIQDSNVLAMDLDVTGTATGTPVTTGIISVIRDSTPDTQISSLSDIENEGYRLRRIVGKCFVECEQNAESTGPPLILVGCGFIILRVDNQGSDPIAANIEEYDIFNVNNDDFPWIWRRDWILQNGSSPINIIGDFPHTNVEYGSVMDGAHLDQKTARVIGPDERLFFVASAMPLVGGTNEQDKTAIIIRLTPRVLGSMRTSSGNRKNASR